MVFVIFYATPSFAEGVLEGRLASLLPTNARWAVSVVDMETGKEIMRAGNPPHPSPLPGGERGHNEALAPGSLIKLFTTGAIYDYMAKDGEDDGQIDMTTRIGYSALKFGYMLTGDIHIKGSGNALITGADLTGAARAFKRHGVTKFTGNIVVDDTLFDGSGITRTRKGPAYARPSAFGMDLHTVAVFVTPTRAGKAPEVRIEPFNEAVRFAVSARTVKGTKNTLKVTAIDDTAYKIEGNIPEAAGEIKVRLPLSDPAIFAAWAFKGALEKEGIEVTGTVKRGPYPETPDGELTIDAPTMDDMIRDMNYNSINVIADNLFLTLGAKRYGAPGTKEKGGRAVRELLEKMNLEKEKMDLEKEKMDLDGVVVLDGSGLSGDNRVTASIMADYLYEASKRPWFERFRSSLPRTGEGTMRDIKFDDKRFRVKTGVLEDVFALAGYGKDRNGRDVSFAYILNVSGAALVGTANTGAEVMRSISTEVLPEVLQ